jgi:glucosamine kinase
MILIADSGSTKTHWCLLTKDNQRFYYTTQGINPYFHTVESIVSILKTELITQIKMPFHVDSVFFYGSGCGSPKKNQVLVNALSHVFKINQIEVNNDLLAAARALCGNEKGIVAILGTGSNTCYYNGKEIVERKGGFGYILGDEGSGAHLGKHLIQDYLNDEMPENIKDLFDATFHLKDTDIFDAVYKKPYPNRYLASFSTFIQQNISEVYAQKLVSNCFELFFEKSICKYSNYQATPFNCVGSVAYYYSDILQIVATNKGITVGKILESPIHDLVTFHCNSEGMKEIS